MTPLSPPLVGIHHVTAIASDAQENVNFYAGILGLRLVKRTVNFDDPGSYHLYYGDEIGRPGTVMTFFIWPGGHQGQNGPPQATTTSFAVPSGSLEFWTKRLNDNGIKPEPVTTRFGDEILGFSDSDGLKLELVATTQLRGQPWMAGTVDPKYAIRGFHSVTLSEIGYELTAGILKDLMGFRDEEIEGNRFRYLARGGDGFASIVDVLSVPGGKLAKGGAGVVHHVAFRTPDDSSQLACLKEIIGEGLNVSPIMDRHYFHSIYYREPGGILFEIATDGPGFTVDEPAESLGEELKLPAQFESKRALIVNSLPPVKLPTKTI